MKEINLEDILNYNSLNTLNFREEFPEIYEIILYSMKEACNQCLDLAAENAIIKSVKVPYTGVRAGGFYTVDEVDKNSILEIKDWIK